MHEHHQIVNYLRGYSLFLDILGILVGVVLEHDEGVLEVDFFNDRVGVAVVMSLQEELIVQLMLVLLNIAVEDKVALLVLCVLFDDWTGKEFEDIVVDFDQQVA